MKAATFLSMASCFPTFVTCTRNRAAWSHPLPPAHEQQWSLCRTLSHRTSDINLQHKPSTCPFFDGPSLQLPLRGGGGRPGGLSIVMSSDARVVIREEGRRESRETVEVGVLVDITQGAAVNFIPAERRTSWKVVEKHLPSWLWGDKSCKESNRRI